MNTIHNKLRLNIDGRMLYMSGIGRCLREILSELVKYDGIEITLNGTKDDFVRYIEEYEICRENISFSEFNNPIYSVGEQFIGSWKNIVSGNNYDVSYYPHYNLPFVINDDSVFSIHDFIQFKFPEYYGKNKVRIAWKILGNAVKKSKKIIVVSHSTANDFYGYFPKFKHKIEVVHNGISKDFKIFSLKEKNLFKGKNRLGKYLLFIGNNKPHKNISRLLYSFKEIKKEYPELQLVIISSSFNLDDYISDLELKRDIIIKDSVSDHELILYYNCAYIFILPSLYEGFGLPIIEAMACGCPVVTSEVSSMPEIGGDAAVYFNPYKQEDITASILRVINDSGLRAKLQEKGIKRSKKFTWEKTANKYMGIFRELKRFNLKGEG